MSTSDVYGTSGLFNASTLAALAVAEWNSAQNALDLYGPNDNNARERVAALGWIGTIIASWEGTGAGTQLGEELALVDFFSKAVTDREYKLIDDARRELNALRAERGYGGNAVSPAKFVIDDVLPFGAAWADSTDGSWISEPAQGLLEREFLRLEEEAPPNRGDLLGVRDNPYGFGGWGVGADPRQEFYEADENEWWASLRDMEQRNYYTYQMLGRVGNDIAGNWSYDEMMQALGAEDPDSNAMILRDRLDEDLTERMRSAAVLRLQSGDRNATFVPSQLDGPVNIEQLNSMLEEMYVRDTPAQPSAPRVNLIDPATLRGLADQQFQSRVGRKASSQELVSFVNGIHAAQRAGVTGVSLDPVARADEFAAEQDPFGAGAVERLNAGRTIRSALQGMGR